MNDDMEPKQCGATNVDVRAPTEHSVAACTERGDIESMDAAELLAITPEEIQLLSATGC